MNTLPTAGERLAQSRERLRLVLLELGSPSGDNAPADPAHFSTGWLA